MTSKTKRDYNELSQTVIYLIFTIFSLFFGIAAFWFNSPQEIWEGFWLIMISPATLLTDYIELANPGATLMNVSLMTLETLLIIRICKAKISGPIIAGILIITGFSFFGKNFFNSLPIIIGALSYSWITRVPLENSLPAALFGTALSPLVSEVSFGEGLSLPTGIILGYLAGFIAGFLIPLLAQHVLNFTKGYSLYNIGFVCGLIGTVFTSLMRNFNREVDTVYILSSGFTRPFSFLLFFLFIAMIIVGLIINKGTLTGLKEILGSTGRIPTDYIKVGGIGATFFNMGVLGIASTFYILFLGGELNGPVLGAIFCLVGFSACGKNIKTVIPLILGATLMSFFTIYNIPDTNVLLAIIFVTALSPIVGRFGFLAGLFAGALHIILVVKIGFLHGGVNLYNNGFAAGFVAGILIPFLDALFPTKINLELSKQSMDLTNKRAE